MYTNKRSSNSDEWETPSRIFDALNREFHFTLDVAATEQNKKTARYYSKLNNGLEQNWSGEICWMNPPYSNKKDWIRKAYEESQNGAIVVCLVPANTDTGWFHEYAIKGEIRFLRGKIKFNGLKWNAPFPSIIIVFRPKSELVYTCF